jgi:DnaJ-class molecular chaperone
MLPIKYFAVIFFVVLLLACAYQDSDWLTEEIINRDLYEDLGISRTASQQEIRKAYRNLAKIHHPDKNNNKETTKFTEIATANEILIDDSKRRAYDNARKRLEQIRNQKAKYASYSEERFENTRNTRASTYGEQMFDFINDMFSQYDQPKDNTAYQYVYIHGPKVASKQVSHHVI